MAAFSGRNGNPDRLSCAEIRGRKIMGSLTDKFSSQLFWDVDPAEVDIQKNKRWLIARVLGYGRLMDWKALRVLYPLAEIVETAQSLRSLDAKTVSFLCVMGRVSKESFRCYTLKQSNPTPWNS